MRAALAGIAERDGPIDVLINNAAQDPGVRLADITEDDFRHTFDVNFFAPVAAMLAVLPAMVARGTGIIVNVSSDGGRLPSPGPGAYPSSKAALSALTESTYFRLTTKGVRVHVVYPAFMRTALGVGALRRGLRQPPRLTIRSVETVSRTILARAGESTLEISASRADRRRDGVPPGPPAGVLLGPKRLVKKLLGARHTVAVSSWAPARNERAAVGGTTCISRSATTSFPGTAACWTPKTVRSTNSSMPAKRATAPSSIKTWSIGSQHSQHKLVFLQNAGIEVRLPVPS